METEQRKFHRQWLAGELVELGPIRFIETLRVVREVGQEGVGIGEISLRCQVRGIEMKTERLTNFLFGYMDDQAEWDEILGILER